MSSVFHEQLSDVFSGESNERLLAVNFVQCLMT